MIQYLGWEDEDVLEDIINNFNTCIFTNAKYNNQTRFPRGFNPRVKRMEFVA